MGAGQMAELMGMMRSLTSTVGELKSEVATLRREKDDALASLSSERAVQAALSKQLAEGVRRTGELQRFLSAELEQHQDVRPTLITHLNRLLRSLSTLITHRNRLFRPPLVAPLCGWMDL